MSYLHALLSDRPEGQTHYSKKEGYPRFLGVPSATKSAALVTSFIRFVQDIKKFKRVKKSTTLLSKIWRGYSAKKAFAAMRAAILRLQSSFRARRVRCLGLVSTGVNYPACTIQRAFVRRRERVVAATKIQRTFVCCRERIIAATKIQRAFVCRRERIVAATKIQRTFVCCRERIIAAIKIQQRVRANASLKNLKPCEHRIRALYRHLSKAEKEAAVRHAAALGEQAATHAAELEALKELLKVQAAGFERQAATRAAEVGALRAHVAAADKSWVEALMEARRLALKVHLKDLQGVWDDDMGHSVSVLGNRCSFEAEISGVAIFITEDPKTGTFSLPGWTLAQEKSFPGMMVWVNNSLGKAKNVITWKRQTTGFWRQRTTAASSSSGLQPSGRLRTKTC
mmetsp:Transcript_22214/g.43782  ORF Transcript_22214/g.43782 Transcript_22214/m.43782 type:complete len:398 (-) Transcript_22214:175-1368(-)